MGNQLAATLVSWYDNCSVIGQDKKESTAGLGETGTGEKAKFS